VYEDFEQKEMDYVRGKISGDYVFDSQGDEIAHPGQTITDAIVDRARDAGQLQYLMIAAASAAMIPGTPDLARRLQEFKDVTEGHEADFVCGRRAGRDVKDYQGNILVREGDTIDSDLIDKARNEALLQELVLAVGAPGLSLEHERELEQEEETQAHKMGMSLY
jgi:hypothetical protein